VKGVEFIDRVKRVGRDRGVPVVWDKTRGKGSHGTLYFGATGRTVVRDAKDQLKTGTLHGMLAQLGLTLKDLYGR
jgi:mRNA interferase HicA